MAIGIGMLFGLKLSSNFAHPFAAQTTAEFWRRWHISLSSWVRDYLFLPLSSFTRRWGQWGVAASLMVTFIALGVWHGAGWTFAVYGFIQGLVIVWELRTERIRKQGKETYRETAVRHALGHPHLPYFCRIVGVLQSAVCFRRILVPAEHPFSDPCELERNQYRYVRPHLHRGRCRIITDAALRLSDVQT